MVQIDFPQQTSRRRKSSLSPITSLRRGNTEEVQPTQLSTLLMRFGPKALALAYGLLSFTIFALRGFYEGCIAYRPRKAFWQEILQQRQRQWELSVQHPSGLRHAFCTVRNGVKLHYLTNAKLSDSLSPSSASKTKNLVIFLHGWPDVSSLWAHTIHLLPSSTTEDCTLVAVDLPGFGGSDGCTNYGPNEVLEVITGFFLAMREQYFDDKANGQVLCVSFDWGAVIGFRLAAEAPELADRFILSNSTLPSLATRNIHERAATALQMFSAWKKKPLHYTVLLKAYSPLKPVVSQLSRSAYVFIFQLPWILSRQTMTRCNLWLLRFIHSLALGFKHINDTPEITADIAGFLGPTVSNTEGTPNTNLRYGSSVLKRARLEHSYVETIRYYREDLATLRWEKDLETILKLSDLHDRNTGARKRKPSLGASSSLKGALGAPATIVWGERDPALDHRIMLEGMDEYLTRDSQIIRLPKIGHWVPRQGEGPAVLAKVIEWALTEDGKDLLAEKLAEVSATAKISVAK